MQYAVIGQGRGVSDVVCCEQEGWNRGVSDTGWNRRVSDGVCCEWGKGCSVL